ncbi:MAG: hypothetical protein A2041_12040 [Bacteroidetes bacterium GWA2_31_9b]|nr:MAG: hypothetical protein A2041_12040 [Bacteroidetes bacterium GWA2_31_9b]
MKKVLFISIAAVLLIAGFILNYTYAPMFSAGEYARNYFAAGDFALGVFAAGKFSAGIFSIGIFSIGIFSVSIFNISIYAVGIFVIAYKKRLPNMLKSETEEKEETV